MIPSVPTAATAALIGLFAISMGTLVEPVSARDVNGVIHEAEGSQPKLVEDVPVDDRAVESDRLGSFLCVDQMAPIGVFQDNLQGLTASGSDLILKISESGC